MVMNRTSNTVAEVAEFLKEQDRVAITTHVGPDGDAIGSAVALLYLMRSLGAEAVFCHREEIPNYLRWLLPEPPLAELPDGHPLLVVDTSREDRAGVDNSGAALNLDHHEDNPLYAKYNVVWADAAATARVVLELYRELEIPLTVKAAEAIYTGLMTDTGGFRFRNISPEVHEIVAGLLRAGVIPAEVHDRLNRAATVEQLNIIGVSLARAVRYGQALISTVDAEDYRRCNATELDSKEAIDHLRQVAGVDVIAHLRETPVGTKASLRSETVDVGEIARKFGGGGHRLAAGYTSQNSPLAARDELLETLRGVVDLGEDA
jgi:phosphoesterase RecJ-like protein